MPDYSLVSFLYYILPLLIHALVERCLACEADGRNLLSPVSLDVVATTKSGITDLVSAAAIAINVR